MKEYLSSFGPSPSGRLGGAIYIHIPFCKQACNYCDFHFSISTKYKTEMILAIVRELEMRKDAFQNEIVESIYFGGGTPSILDISQIKLLLDTAFLNYNICKNPEITLEANPDDLSENVLIALSQTKINRLSIGVQSFFEKDLTFMNRAHNSQQAKECLQLATTYFKNISVDLIYGIPGLSNEEWKQNIQTAINFGISHISSYALTVEPKTALQKLIATGKAAAPSDETALEHFEILVETLENNGFIHYELSNFGKPDYFSQNNSSYWLGKKYIGVGPSAHSFDRNSRSWNVANNSLYIKSITNNELPSQTEQLSVSDSYNEYVMTGLRTIWGVSLGKVATDFGEKYKKYLQKMSVKFIEQNLIFLENNILKTTKKGKFLIDGIASDLFYIE